MAANLGEPGKLNQLLPFASQHLIFKAYKNETLAVLDKAIVESRKGVDAFIAENAAALKRIGALSKFKLPDAVTEVTPDAEVSPPATAAVNHRHDHLTMMG